MFKKGDRVTLLEDIIIENECTPKGTQCIISAVLENGDYYNISYNDGHEIDLCFIEKSKLSNIIIKQNKNMLQAVYKKIVIKPIKKEERTESGIEYANVEESESIVTGEVISIGDKVETEDIKVGDTIQAIKMTTTQVFVDGEEFNVLEQDGVLAVIK